MNNAIIHFGVSSQIVEEQKAFNEFVDAMQSYITNQSEFCFRRKIYHQIDLNLDDAGTKILKDVLEREYISVLYIPSEEFEYQKSLANNQKRDYHKDEKNRKDKNRVVIALDDDRYKKFKNMVGKNHTSMKEIVCRWIDTYDEKMISDDEMQKAIMSAQRLLIINAALQPYHEATYKLTYQIGKLLSDKEYDLTEVMILMEKAKSVLEGIDIFYSMNAIEEELIRRLRSDITTNARNFKNGVLKNGTDDELVKLKKLDEKIFVLIKEKIRGGDET